MDTSLVLPNVSGCCEQVLLNKYFGIRSKKKVCDGKGNGMEEISNNDENNGPLFTIVFAI